MGQCGSLRRLASLLKMLKHFKLPQKIPMPFKAIVIAGPNGAGKTTFARKFLPKVHDCQHFINADLLAQGLSPLHPEREAMRAGRLMLQLICESVTAKETFSIETTLSSRNYLKHLRDWKKQGFKIILIFIALDSPDLAIRRVAQRVREGGHNIPTPTIIRRFKRGQQLLPEYCALADEWYSYRNSDGTFHLTDEAPH